MPVYFFHKGRQLICIFFVVIVKFLGSFLLLKFVRNFFFTDIDFCEPKGIEDFELDFNLYSQMG